MSEHHCFASVNRSTPDPVRLDADRAQTLAETLHRGQCDAGGAPLIDHVRRVAMAVPREARVVAWLHELFEHTAISEEALLREGLTSDELRALRFLTRQTDSRATTTYLAHIELLAVARGPGARVAQTVKRADLTDRARHPSIRPDGWSPPYELGLELLERAVWATHPRSALLREARTPTPAGERGAESAIRTPEPIDTPPPGEGPIAERCDR